MIVRDIMTTHLVTVKPDDTLAHAVTLVRQRQFHHLLVVRDIKAPVQEGVTDTQQIAHEFVGLLTAQDFDLTPKHVRHDSSSDILSRTWQEQRVAEVMDASPVCVTSMVSIGAAAQLFLEHRLSCLPVVEYVQEEQTVRTLLVGVLTRSDLLRAISHAMGTFEPGMQLHISLPDGNITPLVETLQIILNLHIPIVSILAAPSNDDVLNNATLRLRTINSFPLVRELKAADITYSIHPEEREEPL